ncbi:MAG: DNA/RNA non-specific endonuclease [Deltaproteobacteria bacterium]|nr:DNA/RNA non-specific endonuclease [Deltaproteobacteria bacterium]
MGVPKDGDDTDDVLLDRDAFVLSYNPKLEDPNWVSWRLSAADIGDVERQDDFRIDQDLPGGLYRVTPKDYAKSGFDRGHLCPSKDRSTSPEVNSLTFVMTNMQPQRPELNRHRWKEMEEFTRDLAIGRQKQLYVIAGGIFDANPKTIGHGVAVPKAAYKIIVVLEHGQGAKDVTAATEVIAAIMPNSKSVTSKPWTDYRVSIDEVEAATGYDFLGRVPEDVQRVIEAKRP